VQTNFTPQQLKDPQLKTAEQIVRSCVHCGFCNATCPTHVLLGDERDSPRGRIYMIKDMLENSRPATAAVVKHIDRCLSCLSCMTTCPANVHYQHLIDHARAHVEKTYRRPLFDRMLRALLAAILPFPRRLATALRCAVLVRPFAAVLPRQLRALFDLAPQSGPLGTIRQPRRDSRQVWPATGPRRARVALLTGCVQPILAPRINTATINLLTRHGVEVVTTPGCCGAVVHHLGKEPAAKIAAKAQIVAWEHEIAAGGLDAIVINASGCGTEVKDYGFMLRDDPEWSQRAGRVSALTKDITEFVATLGIKANRPAGDWVIAYHSACSMQHGQKLDALPKQLLRDAGFQLRDIAEGHLCCGSAGTYNILQPEIATRLRERKLTHIERSGADWVATGNLGCMLQLSVGAKVPIVHTVELLDYASGGKAPAVR
jgi:glycolate oxidase iron-sulfur subunit